MKTLVVLFGLSLVTNAFANADAPAVCGKVISITSRVVGNFGKAPADRVMAEIRVEKYDQIIQLTHKMDADMALAAYTSDKMILVLVTEAKAAESLNYDRGVSVMMAADLSQECAFAKNR